MTPEDHPVRFRRLRAVLSWARGRGAAAALVVVAVLFGTLLRCLSSAHAPFGRDLGMSFERAWKLATGGELPLVGGPSSWGLNTPFPGYYYLIAPPLAVDPTPTAFTLWGALLCSAGLALFARLLWERYGPGAAIFGSFLAASSPWLVTMGDAPWSPKLSTAIAALLFYAIHRVVAHERSRWAVAIPLALALQVHVYPSLPFTVLPLLGVAVVCRPRWNLRWLLVGALAASLTAVPTLVHVVEHGTAQLGKLRQPRSHPRLVEETVEASWHAFAFATSEISYEMYHGKWRKYRFVPWARKWPGSFVRLYGTGNSVFVVATMLLALLAWLVALGLGLGKAYRAPWRALDPLGVALVVVVITAIVFVPITKRWYYPRYNLVTVWLTLLPAIWIVARRARGSVLLLLSIPVLVLGNLSVLHLYYRAVAPHGASEIETVVETIVHRERGSPFALNTSTIEARISADAVGRVRHPEQWRRTLRAGVEYWLMPRRVPAKQRHLLRAHGAKRWRLGDRGVLLRVPRQAHRQQRAAPPKRNATAPL